MAVLYFALSLSAGIDKFWDGVDALAAARKAAVKEVV